jgi:hypothetical protein
LTASPDAGKAGFAGYYIYRRENAGFTGLNDSALATYLVSTTPITTLEFTFHSLSSDIINYFAVRSVKIDGDTTLSVLSTTVSTSPIESAIEPPTGLTLEGASNQVNLVISWSASATTDVDGYRIYFNGGADPIYEGTATSYEHLSPASGSYEVVAYRSSEESDPLSFNTNSYVHTGSFTVYDMNTPTGSGNSGIGFDWSTGIATDYSMSIMSEATNGPLVDFYYDTDGTFTSADWLTGAWINVTGFLQSTSTYDNLSTVAITGYNNYTYPSVVNGQVWQVVTHHNVTDEWHYAKFRIDAVTMSPYVHAQVTFAFQTIKNFARVK